MGDNLSELNMSHLRTVLSAATGVVFMTLFSALIARFSKHEFAEHKVLAKLLNRHGIDDDISYWMGWKGHLLASLGFAYINKLLLEKRLIEPNLKSGAGVGIMEGLLGIMIWKAAFMLHPNPPKINLTKFFVQLVFAHIVYAMVGVSVMKIACSS
jgi:hypothetical protein